MDGSIVTVPREASLSGLVRRAADQLAMATTAADVLDARDLAGVAYDAAKSAARFAKAKGAHDDVLAKVHRAQADALEIEAMAKRRLADEYDAAQERGEVASQGKPSSLEGFATAADLGLTHKDIHEARQIRDAEADDPGIIRRTIDEKLEAGEEPTKAALKAAIVNRTSFTGDNQWFTPVDHIERARAFLGAFDLDPASSSLAQETVKATAFHTEEDDGLTKPWRGRVWLNPPYAQPAIGHFVEKLTGEVESGNVSAAIMLTHNYTDTTWFHEAARLANAICFTRGRIRFVSPEGKLAAPTQGQAFFYYGRDVPGFASAFHGVGLVVEVRR